MRHTSLSEVPLQHLRLLDLVLDVLFLYSSLLRITPPCRTLILAWNAEIDASTTGWTAFTALFATQATCKATWLKVRYRIELGEWSHTRPRPLVRLAVRLVANCGGFIARDRRVRDDAGLVRFAAHGAFLGGRHFGIDTRGLTEGCKRQDPIVEGWCILW